MTGSTGCNSFSGGYTAQGRVLSIEHLRVSEVDCAPNLQAQEAAVLAVLTEPSLLIELPPGRLVIMAPGSSAGLEYVTTAPLEGPTWLLTSLRGHRLDPRDVVTLRLKDGHVSGEAPCGAYTGAYDTNGVLISMAGLAASTGACPLSALERAYLHALRRAAFLALEGPTLRLHDAGGRTVARFLQPGSP